MHALEADYYLEHALSHLTPLPLASFYLPHLADACIKPGMDEPEQRARIVAGKKLRKGLQDALAAANVEKDVQEANPTLDQASTSKLVGSFDHEGDRNPSVGSEIAETIVDAQGGERSRLATRKKESNTTRKPPGSRSVFLHLKCLYRKRASQGALSEKGAKIWNGAKL